MKTLTGKEALKSRVMEWAAKLDVPIHSINGTADEDQVGILFHLRPPDV